DRVVLERVRAAVGQAVTQQTARADFFRPRWSPASRVVGGVAGALLVGYGMSRRDLAGALIASGGASLAACAGTNLGMKRLTGVGAGRRAVDIQKTMNVTAPLEDVFETGIAPHDAARKDTEPPLAMSTPL